MLPTPNPVVIFQRVDDGAVLFSPVTEIYFGLNEVGTKVWELLPPMTQSLDELCARLHQGYPDVERAVIEADVRELLTHLQQEGLVTPTAARPDAPQTS